MKVGVITFHTALNYGAVLQTYALYKTLLKLGVDAKVIDYQAPFNKKRFAPKTLKYFLNIRIIYNIIFRNSYELYNSKGFKDFVNYNIRLTQPIHTYEGLSNLNKEFDRFITGSDQVWNLSCTEGDNSYYLPFVNDPIKKNSYAASFGYSFIPKENRKQYADLLKGFNHISVREVSGIDIVKSLVGKSAEWVLDPTLLLNKEEWQTLADYSLVSTKKYMLMYLMFEDKVLINKAKEYAKKNNLEIIYISQRLFRMSGVKNLRNVTPEQWLGLFLCAETIATNSFHGLVFSINFNKQFIARYIPRSIANSRLETMINRFNLHSQLMDSELFDYNKAIDIENINKIIIQERNKSIDFIKRIIE